MQSNRGFIELATPMGTVMILTAGLLLVAAIVGTVLLIRYKDRGREYREQLKRERESNGTRESGS